MCYILQTGVLRMASPGRSLLNKVETALKRLGSRLLPLVLLPLALLIAAACSSKSNNTSNTNNAGASGVAATSQSFDQVATDSDAAGTNAKFSITKMTTAVNQPVTVNVSNKGKAIHNFHVLNVQDAAGKDIKDDLIPAGGSNTLTFTIAKAGTYNFQCDVHPTTMKGTITVQ